MSEVLAYDSAAGLSVLDVGCGQGIDLVRYARGGANVTGVDLTPRHVELARAHLAACGLRGEVVEGDAEELPFSDAMFDVRAKQRSASSHARYARSSAGDCARPAARRTPCHDRVQPGQPSLLVPASSGTRHRPR